MIVRSRIINSGTENVFVATGSSFAYCCVYRRYASVNVLKLDVVVASCVSNVQGNVEHNR